MTFGNDIRGPNWGWQALAHETGHVFGLPDLYSYKPGTGRYKDNQKYVGFWDLMGWPGAGSEYLAWHKYKLGWLTDENVLIAKKTSRTALVTPIDKKGDVKAVVVPIDDVEAYTSSRYGAATGKWGRETGVLFAARSHSRSEKARDRSRSFPQSPTTASGNWKRSSSPCTTPFISRGPSWTTHIDGSRSKSSAVRAGPTESG